MMIYEQWCDEVLEILEKAGRVRGRKPDESAVDFLDRCRGDEPFGAYEHDDTPGEYAKFIMTEPADEGGTGYLEEVEL